MSNKRSMGKKKQSAFSLDGYSPALREYIEGLELPAQITCAICHQPYPQDHYSKGQLLSLRHALHTQGVEVLFEQRIAKCPSCCCAAVVERKCRFCNHWKGIDDFARTQRILEQPACKKCQDYYQKSAYAVRMPTPVDNALIETGDEAKPQRLLLANEDDRRNVTAAEETREVDDNAQEKIPPAVTLLGAGETESLETRLLRSAAMPAKKNTFGKVRPTRPADTSITPPASPPPEDSGDERDDDMGTWEYL